MNILQSKSKHPHSCLEPLLQSVSVLLQLYIYMYMHIPATYDIIIQENTPATKLET